MIKIRRGLDLPISGAPRQSISDGNAIRTVAILGPDYPGMKPTMAVQEGDRVEKGQLLFADKKTEGVIYTAPAAGVVKAVHRGAKRVLLSVEIEVADTEKSVNFGAHNSTALASLSREQVQKQLVDSGQWTALRARPFGKVPTPDSTPNSIFVTAMDTNPLAADPDVIISEQLDAFRDGLVVLGRLTDGPVWVCRAPNSKLPSFAGGQVREERFAGPHPAGNAGTHIHFLDPVGPKKTVWSVPYQEVIAIGKLFTTGELYTDRVVALSGPQVLEPRLVRTRVGASTEELTAGQLQGGDNRVISGSVFNGHHARAALAFLSRLSQQVTVLLEGRDRKMFGYLSPGLDRHSVLNIYLSKLMPGKKLTFTTTTNGSERAMVPVGGYEAVMPLDVLPTQLLRALIVGDTDSAQGLGALELVEEDLALCTYVCVGKYEYGPILRDNLTRIELEG
jgi:Na+-transporting NADH:ubiquinone oxidoreductase subunit A